MHLITLLFLLQGCGDIEPVLDTATGRGPTYTGGSAAVEPEFQVYIRYDGIELVITGGEGDYKFGLADTDASCAEDPTACWTGEDCGHLGDTLSDGTTVEYCHTVSYYGAWLAYDEDSNGSDIQEGVTTLFNFENTNSTKLTTFIEDEAGACWIFGNDASHYTSNGASNCTVLW